VQFAATMPEEFAKRNWVFITIDYRLTPEIKIDELWSDCEDSWKWTLNEAPKLLKTKFNTNKTIVMGGSAGGYLALLSGYKLTPRPTALTCLYTMAAFLSPFYLNPQPSYIGRTIPDSVLETVKDKPISGFPLFETNTLPIVPTARTLLSTYLIQKGTFLKDIFGLDNKKELDHAKLVSWTPARNIKADYPPTFLIHGNEDVSVLIAESEEVVDALKKNGVVHEFIVAEGMRHGFLFAILPINTPYPVYDATPLLKFMDKYLQ